MRVLVACEFTQVVTRAFRARGHHAYSCDILPTEGDPEHHMRDDVLNHLDAAWDLMIAFPPCTYLCRRGVVWLHRRPERWSALEEAALFFNVLLNAPIPRIAVENPIQHRYARERIRKPDQIIQPYHYGHTERKATCLWLKNLPPLLAWYSGGEGIANTLDNLSPSPDRSQRRSRTFPGIAAAMADQWGGLDHEVSTLL